MFLDSVRFFDKSTNTNMIVQQVMAFAINNSWKVFLAPDVELRQRGNKFSVLFLNRILMKDWNWRLDFLTPECMQVLFLKEKSQIDII